MVDNTTMLVAVAGAGLAAYSFLGSGSTSSTSSKGPSRADVMRDFQTRQLTSALDTLREQATSSSSPTQGLSQEKKEVIERGEFSQRVVERTGFLPSGFDAAGRVSQIERGNTVGL